MDWTYGMECWTGLLEWNTGLRFYTFLRVELNDLWQSQIAAVEPNKFNCVHFIHSVVADTDS